MSSGQDLANVMQGLDIQGGDELAAKFKASLPAPQLVRVQHLEKLQGQYSELYGAFVKERQALEAKYESLYEPLYAERSEVVSGKKDVEGSEPGAGLPGFWLRALQMNEVVAETINEKDVDVLKHLTDLKYVNLPDDSGFKLIFTFEPNDYFTNEVLEKTYFLMEEDYEPVLEKAEGSTIDWKAGKNVTVKVMKKKPKKGAKPGPPQTKLEPCESFFNFFNPPQIPEDEDELEDDEAEELQGVIEADYELGAVIKEKVIPHAVDWYTGKAVEESMLLWQGDEDIADDEDEDEDEDEEEGEGAAADGEKPAECKQQ